MGEHKQNVPTRFDAETLLRIDEEKERHGFENRSQYIRLAMKKWLRMVAEGTVQLLDGAMQVEHWNNCEHGEQREHSEFPSTPQGRTTPLLGPKPPMRVTPSSEGARRRHLSRGITGCVAAKEYYKSSVFSFHVHFTPLNREAA